MQHFPRQATKRKQSRKIASKSTTHTQTHTQSEVTRPKRAKTIFKLASNRTRRSWRRTRKGRKREEERESTVAVVGDEAAKSICKVRARQKSRAAKGTKTWSGAYPSMPLSLRFSLFLSLYKNPINKCEKLPRKKPIHSHKKFKKSPPHTTNTQTYTQQAAEPSR